MDRIGKYEIHGQIGSGGFATVFKGYDPFIKRDVAIKICYANDTESRQRFFREAEIAGRLKHENITTVYDFGVHNEDPYLVEEYLDGEDLAHRLRRQEPAELAPKIDYLVQIARGLEYAHREDVIHRDIKPGNVRVLDDGTVKIMDFGTAKLAGVESHLTQAGMTLGTVAYLSPERLLGRETGTNSDIFSYGVLAYELLSFRRPFSGRNIPHLIDQVINASPIPLADSWPDCPPALASIVDRCLLKDPAERYLTCTDILSDLDAVALESLGRPAASFRDETTGVPTNTGASANVQVAGFFERGRKLHADGKHERAVMVLEEVLEMAPGHAEARALLDASRAALQDDAATPSTETGLIAIEGPEERKARKRAEAVASIETFLAAGQFADAADALAFAVRMFGPLRDVRGLARRLGDAARRDLATVKGEALRASRNLLDQMIDLRHAGRLDLPTATTMTDRILDFDPDNPAARDLLAMIAEDVKRPPSTPPVDDAQDRKWSDAMATVESHLTRGEVDTAARALDFAVSLYGERTGATALRQRIEAARRSAG